MGRPRLKWRCWQGCVLFRGGSRGRSISWPFPVWRGCPHSWVPSSVLKASWDWVLPPHPCDSLLPPRSTSKGPCDSKGPPYLVQFQGQLMSNLKSICSINSLSSCNVTQSQVPRIRAWPSLREGSGVTLLPTVGVILLGLRVCSAHCLSNI